ncbi:hypothetical protein CWS02_14930 [Enterobacter sp. EA-1]|nr:hypothetical protein CWS02_14930 [Enterobacter sp. EA-1]
MHQFRAHPAGDDVFSTRLSSSPLADTGWRRAFIVSLLCLSWVSVFPSSDRPELIIDWNLPQTVLFRKQVGVAKFEREKLQHNPDIGRLMSARARRGLFYLLMFNLRRCLLVRW